MVAITGSIDVANEVLASYFPGWIERRPNGLYVCWKLRDGRENAKRWVAGRGQDLVTIYLTHQGDFENWSLVQPLLTRLALLADITCNALWSLLWTSLT
jgi:hypothetical protein